MTALLDERIQQQVSEIFTGLEHPVSILFFGSSDPDRCAYCADTRQLLEEVSALSEKLDVQVFDIDQDAELASLYRVDAAPSFVLAGRQGDNMLIDYGIRYKGIPAGHEFSSLVNDLLLVSRRDSNLSKETRAFLKDLKKPVHLQVFVTPT